MSDSLLECGRSVLRSLTFQQSRVVVVVREEEGQVLLELGGVLKDEKEEVGSQEPGIPVHHLSDNISPVTS